MLKYLARRIWALRGQAWGAQPSVEHHRMGRYRRPSCNTPALRPSVRLPIHRDTACLHRPTCTNYTRNRYTLSVGRPWTDDQHRQHWSRELARRHVSGTAYSCLHECTGTRCHSGQRGETSSSCPTCVRTYTHRSALPTWFTGGAINLHILPPRILFCISEPQSN